MPICTVVLLVSTDPTLADRVGETDAKIQSAFIDPRTALEGLGVDVSALGEELAGATEGSYVSAIPTWYFCSEHQTFEPFDQTMREDLIRKSILRSLGITVD